jgi:hypothetical protein
MLRLTFLAASSALVLCQCVPAQTPLTTRNSTPVWGYRTAYATATSVSSATRAARNALFNGVATDPPFSAASTQHPLNYPQSFDRLQRVPLSLADAVILGTAVGGNTYLSADQTTFYTETVLSVGQVISNTSSLPLAAGVQVAVLRASGIIAVTPRPIIVGARWRWRSKRSR